MSLGSMWRPTAAAMATAALLGIGAVACTGAGERTDAAASTQVAASYRDQLVAYLRGTSQGAHVQGADVARWGTRAQIRIDTDLPAFLVDESSAAADAAREAGRMLGRQAEDWLLDHRLPGATSGKIVVEHVGRATLTTEDLSDLSDVAKWAAPAADLLATLRAQPDGGHVTRVTYESGDADTFRIHTDLEAYRAQGDALEPADAGPRARIGDAVLAAATDWARRRPPAEPGIDLFQLLDRDKGIADDAAPNRR